MNHSDNRRLLDQGRKAGLKTAELYSALSTRSPEANEIAANQADSNGYVPTLDNQGHTSFQPSSNPRSH